MLLNITNFNKNQVDTMVKAIKTNSQIHGEHYQAHALPKLQQFLRKKYHIDISS